MRGKREIPALDTLATFQSPVQSRDADGQLVQGWRDEFTAWANIIYKRGTETYEQARMQSQRPVVLTIRASGQAAAVTSEWRAVIAGRVYDIREDPTPTPARAFLQMLAMG